MKYKKDILISKNFNKVKNNAVHTSIHYLGIDEIYYIS